MRLMPWVPLAALMALLGHVPYASAETSADLIESANRIASHIASMDATFQRQQAELYSQITAEAGRAALGDAEAAKRYSALVDTYNERIIAYERQRSEAVNAGNAHLEKQHANVVKAQIAEFNSFAAARSGTASSSQLRTGASGDASACLAGYQGCADRSCPGTSQPCAACVDSLVGCLTGTPTKSAPSSTSSGYGNYTPEDLRALRNERLRGPAIHRNPNWLPCAEACHTAVPYLGNRCLNECTDRYPD